jgi:hypothetical protein
MFIRLYVLALILLVGMLLWSLQGCVVAPTVDPQTHQLVCCAAYSEPYPGVSTSATYLKHGSFWSLIGNASWSWLYGP